MTFAHWTPRDIFTAWARHDDMTIPRLSRMTGRSVEQIRNIILGGGHA